MLEELASYNFPSKQVTKKTILQYAGQSSVKAYVVIKGLLRSYTIDDKGKEHVFMFASEGWIISDIEAQVSGKSSKLFIDTIEDSEVMILDANLLMNVNITEAATLYKFNQALIKRVAVMQNRILSLMSSSAKDRYAAFLEIYPELPNRVPQKMIASYLGITPEALSSIRGQMARQGRSGSTS